MVNIFAFLTGKKKSKRASWSNPPTQAKASAAQLVGSASAASTSIIPSQRSISRQTTRFLSLRTRSSSKMIGSPQDALHRQSSSGSTGRKTTRKESITTVLPMFGFEEDETRDGTGGERFAGQLGISGSTLGLESLSGPPRLSQDETAVVEAVELSVDELKACWVLFGKALRDTGCDAVGLMLPQHQDANINTVHYLLSLFILHHQPSLASSFPSITSYTASRDPKPLYSDLLQSALNDRLNSHEICDILKFSLQHLAPSQTPMIDPVAYIDFVQAEHAASYPLDAYTTILSPRLPSGVGACLDSIFEVVSSIASKSEYNMMSGGKVCLLLGWWICGDRKTKDAKSWKQVYEEWRAAGQKVEHLFYSWIRSQSIKVTLPTRLMELVEAYPFGDSTLEDEKLPTPPPSSFPRHTLAVYLETLTRLGQMTSPRDILISALQGSAGPHMLQFSSLQELVKATEISKSCIDHAIAFESQAFFGRFPLTEDSEIPRGLAMATEGTSGPYPYLTPLAELSEGVAGLARAHPGLNSNGPSHSTLNVPRADWDDFSKTGFGDAPERASKFDLNWSPSIRATPQSNRSMADDEPDCPASTTSSPKYILKAVREERIDIDGAFLPFVEETQLDKISSMFQNIALVRLSSTAAAHLTESHGSTIEWLLLVVDYRPVPVAMIPELLVPRTTSPMKESNMGKKRFSLGGFTTSFRRSISGAVKAEDAGPTRRLTIGGTGSARTGGLGSLAEDTAVHGSHGADERVMRVGEMGELLDSSSQAQGGIDSTQVTGEPITQINRSAVTLAPPTPVDVAAKAVQAGTSSSTPNQLTLLSVTSEPDDWHYIAEGGANLVFGYHGSSPLYRHKALRIPKSSTPDQGDLETPTLVVWRQDLLPKLLDQHYLPESAQIELKAEWVQELLSAAHGSRPDARINHQPTYTSTGGLIKASLMTDLRGGSREPDVKVLSIEIKPKWGFLPTSEFIHPPEAAAIKSSVSRHRLHQHLRGVETKYDPLDLYSGDAARVHSAIAALWDLWETSDGQSNNWRVFVNGKAVSPNNAADVPGNGEGSISDRTLPFILPTLLKSGVLDRLKTLQSTLDGTDISHLAQRFATEYPDIDLFDPTLLPEPSAEELSHVLQCYLDNPGSLASDRCTLRDAIIAYALSATFKDCSIFVTCPLAQSSSGWQVVEEDATVKVIDLDLKPVANLKKWFDLDEKVWKHWRDTHEGDKFERVDGQGPTSDQPPDQLVRPDYLKDLTAAEDNEPATAAQSHGVVPFRPTSASTEAVLIPTPDSQLNDPLDGTNPAADLPHLTQLGQAVSGTTTATTRALHSRTPDDIGHSSSVETGTETPQGAPNTTNPSTPNALSLADALTLSPSMAMSLAWPNREGQSGNDGDPVVSKTTGSEPLSVMESAFASDAAHSLFPSTPERAVRSAGPSPSPGLVDAITKAEEVDDPISARHVGWLDSDATDPTIAHLTGLQNSLTDELARLPIDVPTLPVRGSSTGVITADRDQRHTSPGAEITSEIVVNAEAVPTRSPRLPPQLDSSRIDPGTAGTEAPFPIRDITPVGVGTEADVSATLADHPASFGKTGPMPVPISDEAAAPLTELSRDMPTTPPLEAQQHVLAILAGVADLDTERSPAHKETQLPDSHNQQSDRAMIGGVAEPGTEQGTLEDEITADRAATPSPAEQQHVRAILAGVTVPEAEPEHQIPTSTFGTNGPPAGRNINDEQHPSALAEGPKHKFQPSSATEAITDRSMTPTAEDQQRIRAILTGIVEPAESTNSGDIANGLEKQSDMPNGDYAASNRPITPAPEVQQHIRAVLTGVAEREDTASTDLTATTHESAMQARRTSLAETYLSPDTRSNTPFFTPMTTLEDTEPVYPEATSDSRPLYCPQPHDETPGQLAVDSVSTISTGPSTSTSERPTAI